jgi:integrase
MSASNGRPRKRRGWGDGSYEQLPSGSWRATISLGVDPAGKRVRATATFPEKPLALDWLARKRSERAGGSTVPSRQTLAQWLATWLPYKRERVEFATWEFYADRSTRHLAHLGPVRLSDLSPARIVSWLTELRTTPGEKKLALAVLRTTLEDAVRQEVIPSNPAKKVATPRARKRDVAVWTAAEARTFLAAADADHYAALWRLALDSGARPNELLALRWPDLDSAAGTVHVRRNLERGPAGRPREKGPKTKRGDRLVLLAPSTVRVLAAHRAAMAAAGRDVESGPVFVGTIAGRWVRLAWLREYRWPRLLKRAGVPYIPVGHLRHTCATLLLAAGVSLQVVADRLGHETPMVTLKSYARFLPNQQGQARDAAERLFGP